MAMEENEYIPKEGNTITKADIVEVLCERVGLSRREAKHLVDVFFEEIRSCLERGCAVKLSGFGNFELIDKPQRPGRNPKSGQEIAIAARRVVTFHPSFKLRAAVLSGYPAADVEEEREE